MESLKFIEWNRESEIKKSDFINVWSFDLKPGEKMQEGEVEDVLKACAGAEDEEGFIKYESEYFGSIVRNLLNFLTLFDRYPNDHRIGLCSLQTRTSKWEFESLIGDLSQFETFNKPANSSLFRFPF